MRVLPCGMSRSSSNTIQIVLRVPITWLGRADGVARQISRPGFEATRTDAFRAAIARAFEAFESEGGGAGEGAGAGEVDK